MERDRDKLAKILKVSKLLARPRGFEPLTLGLEMRGIHITLKIEYHTNCPKPLGNAIQL